MPAMTMTGAYLRRIRQRLGLTLAGFGELVSTHWNTIARMERGELRITPRMEKLIRLATQTVPPSPPRGKRRD
jgi:transcriptional regulator with XRE-family HTH domain